MEDFEFTTHKSYKGSFVVFDEPDEISLLKRFLQEVRLAAPRVFVTCNGVAFVETRAALLGLSMHEEIGTNAESIVTPQMQGRTALHINAFHWVNRDSYLP